MSNSLGNQFVVTSFGESHGRCIGAVIDGCPAGLPLDEAVIQAEVDRRRPGPGMGATARAEEDRVEIISGVFGGQTTGAPICLLVWNRDTDSSDYDKNRFLPRPGHADYTAYIKYGGANDYRGGGRFSGRITAGFVMAGAVAKHLLATRGITVFAHTVEIGGITASAANITEAGERSRLNPLRCADDGAAEKMAALIEKLRGEADSLGGVIEGVALGVPAGLGEPVFATMEGDLARALFAVPAVKGVEFGAGFGAARMRGSEDNDTFAIRDGEVVTLTNNAGGILGGITSGMQLLCRVAVKPTASIGITQGTVDMREKAPAEISVGGRHDTCIVPRAVPVVEAMMAMVLADHALRVGAIPGVLK